MLPTVGHVGLLALGIDRNLVGPLADDDRSDHRERAQPDHGHPRVTQAAHQRQPLLVGRAVNGEHVGIAAQSDGLPDIVAGPLGLWVDGGIDPSQRRGGGLHDQQ